MRPSRDYQVQACDLPDHLVPHEGSWVAYGPPVRNRTEAMEAVAEALRTNSHARLLTREVFTR